jgi:uncharacterized membrane protein (DUF4010 family)
MSISIQVALRIVAAAGIGLLVGLEREWAHKQAGVRTFAITALLGTIAWQIAPVLAFLQLGVVVLIILLVNIYAFGKEDRFEITTSLSLAATNLLGMAAGADNFFLAFAGAIAIVALLSWKTELVTLSGKLTEAEIRGTLLLAFISLVVYPLLPAGPVDPWKVLDLRAVWLTVILVSGLRFINYILLRLFGERGVPYSSLLGGLVNSAATSLFLAEEMRADADMEGDAPGNMLLADAAMILRNWILVLLFSLPQGFQASLLTVIILLPMMIIAGGIAALAMWRSQRTRRPAQQQENQPDSKRTLAQETQEAQPGQEDAEKSPEHEQKRKRMLKSPLELSSVFVFGLLFLSLTVISGWARIVFGSIGFLVVVVVGTLASAASSAVLLGQELARGMVSGMPAAIAMFLATTVGLLENVVIFWAAGRKSAPAFRIVLLTLPIILVGGVAVLLLHIF